MSCFGITRLCRSVAGVRIFLYVFIVLPWMYAVRSPRGIQLQLRPPSEYREHAIIVGGSPFLAVRARPAHGASFMRILSAASALYLLASLAINVALQSNRYYTGSLYDLPLVSSFLWSLLLPVSSPGQKRSELDAPSENEFGADADSEIRRRERSGAARLAVAAVISLPLFAIYTLRFAHESAVVRDFRLMTVLIASIPLALLRRLLRTYSSRRPTARACLPRSERSDQEILQRLQAQIVKTEKLVSLGHHWPLAPLMKSTIH